MDGEVVTVQGMRVDPEHARIQVDGSRINVHPAHRYVIINKPAGVVSTAQDPKGRRTVLDLVRSKQRVYPVGRLDADTLGLMLLTNNGELTHRMTHPRYQVRRVYLAKVTGPVKPEAVERLVSGVDLEDGPARAISAKVKQRSRSRSVVEVTMAEGRKHEVRRLLEAVGYPVDELVRIAYGPLKLGDLPAGASRVLTPAEVGTLLSSVGL